MPARACGEMLFSRSFKRSLDENGIVVDALGAAADDVARAPQPDRYLLRAAATSASRPGVHYEDLSVDRFDSALRKRPPQENAGGGGGGALSGRGMNSAVIEIRQFHPPRAPVRLRLLDAAPSTTTRNSTR